MEKNKKKTSLLIKEKYLRELLKENGISRLNPKALTKIEKSITKMVEDLAGRLKEKSIIEGRRTIKEKDVESVLEKKEKYPEI